MLCNLPTERYQVVGRIVHMDFIQENLRTKHDVNFQDEQERPNNIELEVLADAVYVKVTTVFKLFQTQNNIYHYCCYFQRLKKNIAGFSFLSNNLSRSEKYFIFSPPTR